jgi:phage recombination protein Bet
MSAVPVVAPIKRQTLVEKFAAKFSIESDKLLPILKATAFKVKEGEVSNEQMIALLVVADQYGLNPFTREIFAFPDKQNGIVPVVSVDGWTRIINEHPQMNGVEFRYSETTIAPGDKRCPGLKVTGHEWIECVISRKDREKPIVVREYLEEVYREPFTFRDGNKKESAWQTHTKRFHRHKALIQAGRLAFGFAGIYDDDEAQRILEARDVTPVPSGTEAPPAYDQAAFDKNLPEWKRYVDAGKKTPADIIATISSKHTLTDEQKKAIEALAAVKEALATDEDVENLKRDAIEVGIEAETLAKHLGVDTLDGLSVSQVEAGRQFIVEAQK